MTEGRRKTGYLSCVTNCHNGCDMLDRQQIEALLSNRFPGTTPEQIAAAANAIMAMARTAGNPSTRPDEPQKSSRIGAASPLPCKLK